MFHTCTQLIKTALLLHDPTIHGPSLTAPKIWSITNPPATTPASPAITALTLTSEIVSGCKQKVTIESCIAIPTARRMRLLVNPPTTTTNAALLVTWCLNRIHQSKKFASVFDKDINSDNDIPDPIVNSDNAIDQSYEMLGALTLQHAEEPEGVIQRVESVNIAPSVLVSVHTAAGGTETGLGTSPEATDAKQGVNTAGAGATPVATKLEVRGKHGLNKRAMIDEVDAENDIPTQLQAEVNSVDANNNMPTQMQAKVDIMNMTVHVPATDNDDNSNNEMPTLIVEGNSAIHKLIELMEVLTLQHVKELLSC
ncbi:hypothetical protein FRB95_001089 [Tulasnella sp. JGI-2019a]|nr:hypothetical protein FRB95_001089 [Tulasnella sp. JGI-2019a]